MRKAMTGTGVALMLLIAAPASANGWTTAGNVGRDALVVAALGVPAVRGDWKGDLQAAGSLAAAEATSLTLKELVHERRPDGSDDKSFPSGHTALSFAAAMTLEKRYGARAGLPAFVVATFVGVSRVEADKHYAHDVLAGAAIGGVAGWLLTSKQNDRVQLLPWTDRHGGGLMVAAHW